ncbi:MULTISPECIES: ABC transporter ATP-binding protein [unclassified Nocardioides]|uniref:ABC transporter ATP-binding protein n=1 Tax=unclassified Nocardioides TaxID=2615069 RepID=UPI0006FF3094|nr:MULTISPECIES: ABC transporter ATP-binding protein [unclassified Nocardioides]KQY63486.1 ABC transporter ATP-binding protein [Nocardioides sp. Root140]KRF17562.1 ABC transporter ATP-binding protein [Nocardioides sp. Soil796]
MTTTQFTDRTRAVEQKGLEIRDVSLRFGGVHALDGVSFDVKPGELLSIIGPNGAGKSSLLNCISGFYRPQQGGIYLDGQDLTRLKPHQIAGRGIGRVFQNIELFSHLTVLENVMLGRHHALRPKWWADALYFAPRQLRKELEHRRVAEEIIDFVEIEKYRQMPVGQLSYGLQKRVELARALAMEPAVLLLDEPVGGMNQEETEDMVRYILDVKEQLGTTVVLIEHHMGVVVDISDRVVVIDFGRKVAEGPPREIAQHPEVLRVYLGKGGDPE